MESYVLLFRIGMLVVAATAFGVFMYSIYNPIPAPKEDRASKTKLWLKQGETISIQGRISLYHGYGTNRITISSKGSESGYVIEITEDQVKEMKSLFNENQ